MDLDLRKVRYFVAVAEELHFGRAAERLHVAQPVLSRQIRALEHELRAQLFSRDRRSTALTAAGEKLLAESRPLLQAAEALQRRVRAATGEPVFTIGFMPGITVTAAVQSLRAAHPGTTVRLVRTGWHDQVAVLHDGRVDVSIVRLPIDVAGLETRALFTEPRVAVVPADHRLAGKESIEVVDLAEEHLLQDPDAVPQWRDVAVELRDRDRTPVPTIHSMEEKLELVAQGDGVAVIPLSTARFYTRPDISVVPISDVAPNQVSLAWTVGQDSPLVAAFAEAAAALLPARA